VEKESTTITSSATLREELTASLIVLSLLSVGIITLIFILTSLEGQFLAFTRIFNVVNSSLGVKLILPFYFNYFILTIP